MNSLKLRLFLLLAIALGVANSPIFAQQPQLTEKEKLVSVFRSLTGANNVNLNINAELDDVKASLSALVAEDPELNATQKQELAKSASESFARINQDLLKFLYDKDQVARIGETAVFQVYDIAFTEAELIQLIAFYETPAGQKALRFLPTVSKQVEQSFGSMIGAKINESIGPKIRAEREALKEKIKAAKSAKP